ncbi:MAG: hypothetical protein LM581_01545 [Desulfurococcales archaeon]|nr:hypothetical protein [Desulfurococcales archaeon]
MSISGEPPLMIEPPKGCRFHPRCPFKLEICDKQEPILINLSETRRVACHLYK